MPGLLGDPEFLAVVGGMPLRKVPGMNVGLTPEALDCLPADVTIV